MRATRLWGLAFGVNVGLVGFLLTSEARALCPAQLPPPGWERQLALTVSNPGPNRPDTIMLATIDTAGPISRGEMRADGGDIRIATSSCSLVPFWIESGLNTTTTKIWMRLPLATGSSQIDLYYGTQSATSASSLASVFGPGLVSLFTFTENTGGTVFDRAGSNDLTMTGNWDTGPLPGVGAVGGFASGRLFRSGNGPALGAGSFTALSLLRPTNTSGSQGIIGNYSSDTEPGWVVKIQGTMPGRFMLLTNPGGNGNWCQGDAYPDLDGNGNIPVRTWSLVGARREAGVTNTLLHNGAAIFSGCPGDTRNVNGPGPFEIGHTYNGTLPFRGKISMSFVYNRALPDAEFAALDAALRSDTPPRVTAVGVPPGPPVIGTATLNGNGTSASVTFSPPANPGSGPITGYEAKCAPSGSGTGSSPITVNGLSPGQTHTCAVRAANSFGVGPWSGDSNSFVAGDAPSISSPNVASFVVGKTGTFTITAAGAPPPSITVGGTLPAGLSSTAGVIQGTPAFGSVGVYPVAVTATNGIVPDATQSLTVAVLKADQTITISPVDPQVLGPQKINLVAVASSGLNVALQSTTPTVCTVSGNVVTLVATGVCTISGTQPGNADFNPANGVTTSFEIVQAEPTDGGATDGGTTDGGATDGGTIDGGSTVIDASTPPGDASSLPPTKLEPPTSNPIDPRAPLESAGIEGGGCACEAVGGAAPMSGLSVGILGLIVGVARRRGRRGRRDST